MGVTAEEQDGGRFLIVATDKALAFAAGSNDRLVAVCFVAVLRAWAIPATWDMGDPLHVEIGADKFGVRADTGTDYDTFDITRPDETWAVVGRVMPGPTPLVLLLGVSSILHQHKIPAPLTQLGRLTDWRRQWPQFHNAYREEAA